MAIARGAALTVGGADLQVAFAEGDGRQARGTSARFSVAGDLVSDGKLQSSKVTITDGSGASIRVGESTLLGELELVVEGGRLLAIDVVDVERYVASVVGAEVPVSWPDAALQAQAIAARTYVLRRKLEGARSPAYHVESSVLDQVYRGVATMDPRTVAAADATAGRVLTFRHELAEAYFFSSCRGRTETGADGLGRELPYLQSVACEGGETAPNASWSKRIDLANLARSLMDSGALGDRLERIEVVSRTSTGRVNAVRLVTRHGARTVSGTELRKLLGYTELPSLDFEVKREGGALVISGGGAGHGVGMCQWCARGQADAGRSADEILAHFYPGTEILRMY